MPLNDTNLTAFVLDRIAAAYGLAGTGTDRPVLLNADDATVAALPANGQYSGSVGDAYEDFDLTIATAIQAQAGTTTSTPVGGEYARRVVTTVDVRIEGADTSQFGHVAGDDEFRDIVREVERALLEARNYPVPGEYHTLRIPETDERFADSGEYYRADLTVEVRGYEEP